MDGLRELEYAIKELGFVGAHLYPHWFEMAPDDRPLLSVLRQVLRAGHPDHDAGRPLPATIARPRSLPSVGRPITLDRIASDFPELKLVGIHIGWPWVEEMIAVAYKHANVYIGSRRLRPGHWDDEVRPLHRQLGPGKVIFGTDWPVIDPERAVREVGELGLRESPYRKMMRDNAVALFGLTEMSRDRGA